MPLCAPAPISLTDRKCTRLQMLVRRHKTPHQLVIRARIFLEADAGRGVSATAAALQVSCSLVQRWRRRWRKRADRPLAQRLSDEPRPGTPATFTPEQICSLIALACETPVRDGVQLARWTYADLAAEAIEREIVDSISPHSIGRFLSAVDLKSHRVAG